MPTNPISRRSLLSVAGATRLVAGPWAETAEVPWNTWPAQADHLVRNFGVGIHLNYRGSVYSQHSEVQHWLRRLGVRHVRTRLSIMPEVLDTFADFARHGIQIQAVCGAFGDDQPMEEVMAAVRRRFRRPERIFSAFEGINEPNNNGVPWVAETRAKTVALHSARRAHGLARIPIVAPALASVSADGVEGETTLEQAQRLGSLQDHVDLGNMHVYPRGLPPSADIDYFRRCAGYVSGRLPIMCTEGGYFTAMDYEGGAHPVPEGVAAAYAPQAVLEHWLADSRRFFRYELLDEPDAGTTDREGTLGMIATSGGVWRPKRDFRTVRRLLATLHDPGPSFRPRRFAWSLSSFPDDVRYAIFARRDGSHVLALWLDRAIYDPTDRRLIVDDLTTPLDSVRLELGSSRDVEIVNLADLTAPALRITERRPRVDLTPGVTLVTIR